MFRKLSYCIPVVGLLLIGPFSLQAQEAETCDFAVNQEATVFDDLQTVTDAGIAAASWDVMKYISIITFISGDRQIIIHRTLFFKDKSEEFT